MTGEAFLIALAVLALVGWLFNIIHTLRTLSEPEVSRTFYACEGCFGIIRPGTRIGRTPNGKVCHIGCM